MAENKRLMRVMNILTQLSIQESRSARACS